LFSTCVVTALSSGSGFSGAGLRALTFFVFVATRARGAGRFAGTTLAAALGGFALGASALGASALGAFFAVFVPDGRGWALRGSGAAIAVELTNHRTRPTQQKSLGSERERIIKESNSSKARVFKPDLHQLAFGLLPDMTGIWEKKKPLEKRYLEQLTNTSGLGILACSFSNDFRDFSEPSPQNPAVFLTFGGGTQVNSQTQRRHL
jgi:hypothetical protein